MAIWFKRGIFMYVFKLCDCGMHPYIHGHFIRENNKHEHLSENFFSQNEAWVFIQQALESRCITEEEAARMGRDVLLLHLPLDTPSPLEQYEKQRAEQKELETKTRLKEIYALFGTGAFGPGMRFFRFFLKIWGKIRPFN